MSVHTVKNAVGVVAILGIYQFLHTKDPTFPGIFTLIAYAIDCAIILSIAFGGYYGIHQYLGLVFYAITDDILGLNKKSMEKFSKMDPTIADKYTEQDSDPEDPANYTSIG